MIDLEALSENQILLLTRLAAAFKGDAEYSVGKSDFVTKGFLSDFGDYLKAHHCFSEEPFTKDKFEYAMVKLQNLHGRKAQKHPNTMKGPDIDVFGVPWSLKTQAEKSIKPEFIHISKFMELGTGIWEDKIEHLHGLRDQFLEHLSLYERIFILRRLAALPFYYELVEIPKRLLLEAEHNIKFEFSPRSKKIPRTGHGYVYDKAGKLKFDLYFDGAGERKLHINKLDKSLCQVHATWKFA